MNSPGPCRYGVNCGPISVAARPRKHITMISVRAWKCAFDTAPGGIRTIPAEIPLLPHTFDVMHGTRRWFCGPMIVADSCERTTTTDLSCAPTAARAVIDVSLTPARLIRFLRPTATASPCRQYSDTQLDTL